MNPAEKYMSQASSDIEDIKFVPLSFVNKSFREDSDISNDVNLDLFPSETGLPKLFYSREPEIDVNRNSIPTTFDALRSLDLDFDETQDLERNHCDSDVNRIYSKIEKNHPGIFETLYSYKIPCPIARVIIKRLIKLAISYSDK